MTSEIFIAIFGVTAVYFSQQANEGLKKWASVFGLLSQPFWFYSMWTTEQYVILALCFVYAYAWGLGFYNYWVRPTRVFG